MWEVKECKLSNLFFLSDGNDVYREEYGQKTWYFAAEAQEKADELNVLNPVSEGVIKPQVKVEYEKVECDIWNIATLKEDFEAGNLFHKKLASWQIVTELGLFKRVHNHGFVYRRIETPVTLESELEEIGFKFYNSRENIDVEDYAGIGFQTIHKLSAILKKHGK